MINLIMATFIVGIQILIGSFKFDRANYVKVNESWKEIVDTAVIRLPLLKGKVNAKDKNESLASKIKEGDRVEIKMSYKGLTNFWEYEEFKGFVKRVSPEIPMEIECEDAGYWFKRINLKKSWRKTNLKEVVNYIVDEVNKESPVVITLSGKIPNVDFDKFRLASANGLEALQKLKENFGLVAYFDDTELFVGLAYSDKREVVKLNTEWNVKNSKGLKYRNAEDVKIKLKATSLQKDNTKITVEVGDEGGEERVKFYDNISSKATLKKLSEQDIKEFKYDGFEGDVHVYLNPKIRHSDAVDITDPRYENKDGRYIVEQVETVFDGGIDRKVTIGIKAS